MFRDWIEDDKQILGECFAHDVSHWKTKKFVPEFVNFNQVTDIVHDHFESLKEIHIRVCCESSRPDLRRDPFYKFLSDARVIDRFNLPKGICDTLFKATNFEFEDSEHNDDNALTRFEFLEILVRVAKARFLQSGEETNITRAFLRLLHAHILPMNLKLIPWQEWREKELWCNEVNDELEVNIRGIKKLFDFIA